MPEGVSVVLGTVTWHPRCHRGVVLPAEALTRISPVFLNTPQNSEENVFANNLCDNFCCIIQRVDFICLNMVMCPKVCVWGEGEVNILRYSFGLIF